MHLAVFEVQIKQKMYSNTHWQGPRAIFVKTRIKKKSKYFNTSFDFALIATLYLIQKDTKAKKKTWSVLQVIFDVNEAQNFGPPRVNLLIN